MGYIGLQQKMEKELGHELTEFDSVTSPDPTGVRTDDRVVA